MKQRLYLCVLSLLISIGLSGCEIPGGSTNNQPTAAPTGAPAGTSSVSTHATVAISVDAMLEQIATLYYDAIQARNYPQAYAYLDADATDENGQTITLNGFEQLAQTMDSQEGPVVSFTEAAFVPMVVMTVTRAHLGPYHAHLQMKQEEHTWKIISLDRI